MVSIFLEDWVNRRRERQAAERERERAERQRQRAEAVAEGEAKGRAETHALWRAWNWRRLDAAAKGEPFDELPPDIAEMSGNGR